MEYYTTNVAIKCCVHFILKQICNTCNEETDKQNKKLHSGNEIFLWIFRHFLKMTIKVGMVCALKMCIQTT